ncbi:hypothetical protein INP93_01445 [Haemophilus parainfluenzae]|uniref:DUF6630 family protein n=1 Tax=Haemophilus parainfluenzae TaxID=729 RepID=UPI0018A69A74|nr:hypothetical protein [Haemophilus parainfluenzae]QOR20236.1 hypothetical protein INP93_01445 [Haemophilus parainfluenzae]
MFFKSKQHADKLDKTLITKLDKIFQYFKAAKVEAESDYTLLYVDTGSDNFYCLVCPKSAAPRIIEIADILNLPINH